MVWRNLSLYYPLKCLITLCHALFVWKTRQSTRSSSKWKRRGMGGLFRKACRSIKIVSKPSELTCKQSEPARYISKIEKRRSFGIWAIVQWTMPEWFFQKALHCEGFAGFGRKSFVFELQKWQFRTNAFLNIFKGFFAQTKDAGGDLRQGKRILELAGHVNSYGILAQRPCDTVQTAWPRPLTFPSGAEDSEAIVGIKKRCRQELLSLMAENGKACTTHVYFSPTPGFFAPYLVCIFLALRSAPLRYESWTLKRRLVAT